MQQSSPLFNQLFCELNEPAITPDGEPLGLTKGTALVRQMVDQAVKGDQRMLATVIKLIEKLDALQAATIKEAPSPQMQRADWLALMALISRYRPHLDSEIERLQEKGLIAKSAEWSHIAMEDAPWYAALYAE